MDEPNKTFTARPFKIATSHAIVIPYKILGDKKLSVDQYYEFTIKEVSAPVNIKEVKKVEQENKSAQASDSFFADLQIPKI